MAGALELLAREVTPSQALKLASSLEIDGHVAKAQRLLPDSSSARALLATCLDEIGPTALASVLRGFSAAARGSSTNLRAVWSGPTFPGDGDHTTGALSHLIDEATEDVFASTFSATTDSGFVSALWRAVARGVQTTLLLDSTINDGKTAEMLRSKLAGARLLRYRHPDGGYGAQHSKVVIADSAAAFVTSANFSQAGSERNLETGVLVRDSEFASRMRQRFSALRQAGAILDLDGGS